MVNKRDRVANLDVVTIALEYDDIVIAGDAPITSRSHTHAMHTRHPTHSPRSRADNTARTAGLPTANTC
jgi:hypothetical protein